MVKEMVLEVAYIIPKGAVMVELDIMMVVMELMVVAQ